ncbi:MAG: hypothetical protein MI739_07750 [Bacteroidales bacterium]|nr:hypothetical protein [Bacteroidales bacterium]
METAGLIISIVAILFSLITYFVNDNKIKRQERLLNEYQLNKIAKEKEESKKAIIEANVTNYKKEDKLIRVYNKGKCTARDVEVFIPETQSVQVKKTPCPIDIISKDGIDIELILLGGHPNKIEISFTWKDDFKEDNEVTQMIQL